MNRKLEGKVAVITGAAGVLGAAIAEQFASEGAKVALVDLNQQALDKLVHRFDDRENVMGLVADVSKEHDVQQYVKQVVERWGRIDIFMNNAGIIGKTAFLTEQTTADFDAMMNLNVRGVFLGLKYVLPVMTAQQYGSIINTSSVSGLMGSSGNSLYSAAKHAVVGLTKTAALEVAKDSVRVNSIHPAPLTSSMMETIEQSINKGDPARVRQTISSRIPLGRYGQAEEVAKLVMFLASDDSSFITGSQYRIDGGMGAR
ncbi:SDR family oxidoreductase [Planococcus sp. CP5-4]|uniref:SDR family NAD(P)-dependent oxidoreductase n=1 Tax=unclassified Planococcus (in: firmicutes) TaxID=2662419 RepID=UPI001C21231D|nr:MULTISPECIES: SDR family NAD(P)-dependent oxidoreductase [unclassified Planococcus (in: firmicutes)]MBU9673734.1 SDR family oxidoreductase [Planococcus sp. CP5-4_YE]MBV0908024.1 SDR family oxidoreductase [Planococcus sp. CP5-4_UN]MBW6063191.1 SDR family oxidoreductase [Planococcus sp. CP5-4]